MGVAVTNQNFINEEINSTVTLGIACYHSVQHLLSSILIDKNSKIKN
jgi:hypothetical protein